MAANAPADGAAEAEAVGSLSLSLYPSLPAGIMVWAAIWELADTSQSCRS